MKQTEIYEMDFLLTRATDKERALSEEEYRLVTLAQTALKRCSEMIVCLGGRAGRLGECVVGTGLFEGALHALLSLGRHGVPITLLVDKGAAELFQKGPYQQKYWPDIQIVYTISVQEKLDELVANCRGKHILVLDLHGGNDGTPYIQFEEQVGRKITTLGRLFRAGLRDYAFRGQTRRYADFMEDLFELHAGTIDGSEAQPRILLSSEDRSRYPLLLQAFDLHRDALQVICFFQSVVLAKCYGHWLEVMESVCKYVQMNHPKKRVDFLLACGPEEDLPEAVRKSALEEEFGDFCGIDGNARVQVRTTPSLRDLAILLEQADLVLANDTGPGHIAGALAAPTITPYLPGNLYSMRVWASTLWHRGVTLEPSPFSYQELKNAILWGDTDIIDHIPPENLSQEAIHCLQSSPL